MCSKMYTKLVLFTFVLLVCIALVKNECIAVKECPAALKYLKDYNDNNIHNSSIEVLKKARCGDTQGTPKVLCEQIPDCYQPTDKDFCVKVKDCCAAKDLLKKYISGSEKQLVKQKLRSVYCKSKNGEHKVRCGSLLEIKAHKKRKENYCLTPSGFKGNCIPLQECPTFLNETATSSQNFQSFLKMSYCDKENDKVCCASEEDVDNVCGMDNTFTNRILGGTITKSYEFPWVVILKYEDPQTRCGGSFINSQFVLTAAHCIQKDLIKVQISGNYQSQGEYMEFSVLKTKKHPLYMRRRIGNDIGILQIVKTDYQEIRWICLPPKNQSLPTEFTAVGNGVDESGTLKKKATNNKFIFLEMLAKYQKKITLFLQNNSSCLQLFKSYVQDIETNLIICAGDKVKDTCRGDSGGPLMSKNTDSKQWYLNGLTSHGLRKCGGAPGIYTRVDKYLDWIGDTMRQML